MKLIMHVWFGFIFRCEALQEYWRHPEVLQNDLQYFTTFKTTKLMNQVSSSDSHSLIFSSEISELKAKTSEWPRFTNIRRNYTNVLSTENCPYRPNFCAFLRSSKIIRVVWSEIEPQIGVPNTGPSWFVTPCYTIIVAGLLIHVSLLTCRP